MDPQAYIIAKIEAEMTEIGAFSWLKFISETSLLKVEDYPALLVEDEKPYGTEDMAGDGTMVTRAGDYIMSLIIKTKNLNKMTRADYREAKALAIKYIEQIENYLVEQWKLDATHTVDDTKVTIIGLGFEKADMGFIEIDSQPALILQMPVKAKYIIN